MEQETIIIVSVFAAAWAFLLLFVIVMCVQLTSLKRKVTEMQTSGRLRVQKLKMNADKNFAFHNAGLTPDEELARRGYSMYMGPDGDVEAGSVGDRYDHHRDRHDPRERQTGGHFIDDLARELEVRQQRQSTAPPFLLQGIEENKRKSRAAASMNPMANGRQSDTNPNFIY